MRRIRDEHDLVMRFVDPESFDIVIPSMTDNLPVGRGACVGINDDIVAILNASTFNLGAIHRWTINLQREEPVICFLANERAGDL